MPAYIRVCITALIYLNHIQAHNILAVLPYPGRSHHVAFLPFFKELARRGNNVTLISHYPQEKPLKNLNEIILSEKEFQNWVPVTTPSYLTVLVAGVVLVYTGAASCKTLLDNQGVQDLWKYRKNFDVVLVEQFNSDCSLGLAYELGAPVVGITANSLMPQHYKRYGVPDNPSYTRNQVLGGRTRGTLFERVERTLIGIYINYMVDFASQFLDEYYLRQYFPNIPPIKELEKNIKFLLLYQHFVLNSALLLPSNVIEVAGHHVLEPKTLPKDLKRFIEESKHGVIYISFGSMIKATSLSKYKLQAILDVLEELPQRVIWKWDNDNLPFEMKKIYSSKWLPQNDILAHPNVVAFFSHCGQVGITEAIHYGVPVLGIPMFGDQISNAAAVEESGLGVQTAVNDLTKENLMKKFKTILDPDFRSNVKILSRMYRDRPVSSLNASVFWTEFVARYPNATFRSPILNVPLYQYYCFDVLAVFILLLLLIFMLIKAAIRCTILYISYCLRRKPKNKSQ
ncbi:UDP-glycosyltransferase UGT5-like [Pieris rapae]|uniref:UDP-glycosyltransferase UGT5-like n=1 Tax=Pieris rapae TaxID=64459 RepID=UPI001E2802E4|nr:UDP-glycosyltransferase UGT5-like [Pieris rapae]